MKALSNIIQATQHSSKQLRVGASYVNVGIRNHEIAGFGEILDPSFEQHLPPEDTQIMYRDVGDMQRLRFGQEILSTRRHEGQQYL